MQNSRACALAQRSENFDDVDIFGRYHLFVLRYWNYYLIEIRMLSSHPLIFARKSRYVKVFVFGLRGGDL